MTAGRPEVAPNYSGRGPSLSGEALAAIELRGLVARYLAQVGSDGRVDIREVDRQWVLEVQADLGSTGSADPILHWSVDLRPTRVQMRECKDRLAGSIAASPPAESGVDPDAPGLWCAAD